jgi:plastocyanin
MRSLRPAAIVGLAVLVALALAACTSASGPGWTYAPAPPATPTPVTVSAAPSAGGSAPASAAVSPSAGSVTIALSAQNIAFDKASIGASAGSAFQIQFSNNDAGVPHNVAIKDANGNVVFAGEIFSGVAERTYQVPALPPGNYTFFCQVHPSMTGTLVVAP